MSATRSFTDADLNAYIDGEVTDTERAAIEAWLLDDPQAAAHLKSLRALDQRLKGTFEFVLEQPATQAMQSAVLAHAGQSRRTTLTRAAAAVVLALVSGAAGYALHGWIDGSPPRTAFADTALGAHTVFTPEVRHPVEVVASEEEHLVKWLTKRVGAPIRAPRLQEHGFKLVGGRLLSDGAVPAAQFMYESAEGQRLTLYARRDPSTQDSSFAFTEHGALSAFTWVDRPLAYALVGKLPRETLFTLARTTYEQLQK